jgi:general secretion pathway protein E
LASVHANDSIGVLFRLADLGIESFLLASALVGVAAQRMVRKVCPNCHTEMPVSIECQEAYFEETGEHRKTFVYGKGCQLCANTGYLGRTAVMELLTVSDEIKRLLLTGASTAELRAKAIQEGMVLMRHDGMLKVKAGITTPDEILRNVFSL